MGRHLLLALACFGSAAAAPEKDRHVVLISLDGFPAYLWRDPSIPLPNLRKLAAAGASTDAMTVVNPSVTWINHTTLITGVSSRTHGVMFNGLLVRQGANKAPKVDAKAEKRALIHAPTLDDVVHAAGLTVGESAWPALTGASTVAWSFPELPTLEGKLEKELLTAGALSAQEIGWMQLPNRKNVPFLDEAWARAAAYIFTQHRPNLLLLHLANIDFTHHRFGPASPPSYTALAYADRLVGDVVRAVDESGRRAHTTIIVTTDHGFKKVQKFAHPNVVLKKAGLLRNAGPTVTECDAYVVTEGGSAFVFITNPARKEELKPKLTELFRSTEGVESVLDGNEAPSLGMPTPAENQGMGDLVIFAKAGFWFNSSVAGDAVVSPAVEWFGAHGYRASDPELDGIFIASGAGIKVGAHLERIRNLDVAPTVARLLGVEMPFAEGRPLTQILVEKP